MSHFTCRKLQVLQIFLAGDFKLHLSSPLNAARPLLARCSLKATSLASLSWLRGSRSNECLPYTGCSQTEPGSGLHSLFTWDVVKRDHQNQCPAHSVCTLYIHSAGFGLWVEREKSLFEVLWEANRAFGVISHFFYFISIKVSEEFLHLVFQLRDLTLSQLRTLWHEASFKCRNDWLVFFFGFMFNAALIRC